MEYCYTAIINSISSINTYNTRIIEIIQLYLIVNTNIIIQ